ISPQTCRHARKPAGPVAQFAFPELTITARTEPLLAGKELRPTCTGAAVTWLVVNTAAAVVLTQHSTRARSGRPLGLMPAATEENANPCGRGNGFSAEA